MVALDKCPTHPNSSGTSQYGGLWCYGNDKTCKWAVKEFVNDTPDGGVEKVTKYHPPQPGRWLTKEDYISTLTDKDNPVAPSDDFPPDDGLPTEATESLPEATVDREHSIVRQTCIKAASVALQHSTGNAEEKAGQLTYLAGVYEDWCWR